MSYSTKEDHELMKQRTVRDDIDRELTRAFFGGAERKKTPEPPAPPPPPPKPKMNFLPIYIAIGIIGIIVIFAAYFLSQNKITFSVKVQAKPPAPRVYKSPLGNILNDRKPLMPLSDYKHRPAALKGSAKEEKTLYDFERDEQGWEIPSWETDKADHVAYSLRPVEKIASKGKGSIEVYAEFPGGKWTGALVEISQFLDLSKYDAISVDIYIPPSAPANLKGKIILTAGESWQFSEMARGVKLTPGKWNTLSASLAKGSTDWRQTKVDDNFRSDIRKIAVRVEAEKAKYSGPIYIDNVRLHIAQK